MRVTEAPFGALLISDSLGTMSPNRTEAPAGRTRAAVKGNVKADPKAKADELKKRQPAGNPSGGPVGTRGIGPSARTGEVASRRGRTLEIDTSEVVASASPSLMNRNPLGFDKVSQKSPKRHNHAHVATNNGTAGSTSTWSGVGNVGPNTCGSSDSTGQPTPVPEAETGFAQSCLTLVLAILDERSEEKKRVVPERLVNRVGAELAKIRKLAQKYVLDNVRLGAQVEILVAWGTPKQGTDSC